MGVPFLDASGEGCGGGGAGDGDSSLAPGGQETEGEGSTALAARMTEVGQSGSHDIQKRPRAVSAGGPGAQPRRGGRDLDADGFAGGISADEDGIAAWAGYDQAEVAAQLDEHVREVAPFDEVAPEGVPAALAVRRTETPTGRDGARQFGEKVDGLGPGGSARMSD